MPNPAAALPQTEARQPAINAAILKRAGISLALILAIAAAWLVTQSDYYTAGSDLGYYMGLVGGVMMLMLLTYPLRKHLRFMHGWGPIKPWFRTHMFLGIAGPTLILFHSTFRIGSLNAGVALVSMLLVAGSGVIGRFIYTRIHHGLYGSHANLKEMQAELGLHAGDVESKLRFAPHAEALLQAFEARAKDTSGSFITRAWRFMTLGWHKRRTYRRCLQALKKTLKTDAAQHGLDRQALRKFLAEIAPALAEYVAEIQRVHQFAAYERMFSLWHVLHVPFVYMLAFSAIFHVVAVHMY